MTGRCAGSLASLLVGAGVSAPCGAQSSQSLDGLPERERNARLIAAIHDAGYVCDEVVESMKATAAMPAWRVVCRDALVYLASDEEGDGALHVAPLPYTDPVTPVPTEPVPVEPPQRRGQPETPETEPREQNR